MNKIRLGQPVQSAQTQLVRVQPPGLVPYKPANQVDALVQEYGKRFNNKDCFNERGTVEQAGYVRSGKVIPAKQRRNGSRSFNSVTSCRMSKKERMQLRDVYKQSDLMPECGPNQIPVVGYIRFDSEGNPYPVKGMCRDVKIKPDYASLQSQSDDVLQYVKREVQKEKSKAPKRLTGPSVSTLMPRTSVKREPNRMYHDSELDKLMQTLDIDDDYYDPYSIRRR